MRAGEAKALSFVIAHELAHHALGHTGRLRGAASTLWKKLSRLDELSCDAVAAGLVEDSEACAKGLGLFLVGPELVGHVDWKALDSQASDLLNKERWKAAEGSLSHPLLLRRYAALRGFGR
jgi:Zn-dependent protease with chaperone function